MKKNRIFSYIALVTALILCLSMPVVATEPEKTDVSVTRGSHSTDAAVPIFGSGKLLESSGAAVLYETNSDTMMYAWNPDMQLEPASLVKIMTAILAVENGELSDVITVSAEAVASLPHNITADFKITEVVTLEQLLYCMMVGSSNDAALIIAHHIAGSHQAFVEMMNSRAQALGCTNTHFMNAHGLRHADQYTTARDMVRILRDAMQNPLFMKFFGAVDYTLSATNLSDSRYMITTNYMIRDTMQLYYDKRVTGGRTGVTDSRRRCLAVTAESKGLSYIAIILEAVPIFGEDGVVPIYFGSYEEAKQLFNMGFDGYSVRQVLSSNDVLDQFPVLNGDNHVGVGPASSVSTVLPSDVTAADLSFRYESVTNHFSAPLNADVQVSRVEVWYKNICVAQSAVVTKNSVSLHTNKITDSLGFDNSNMLKTVLLILGAILLIGLAAYVLMRRFGLRFQPRRRIRRRRRRR